MENYVRAEKSGINPGNWDIMTGSGAGCWNVIYTGPLAKAEKIYNTYVSIDYLEYEEDTTSKLRTEIIKEGMQNYFKVNK